mgnify:CR=1 FL=1
MSWEDIIKKVQITPKHLNLLEEYINMWNTPVFPLQFISFLHERNVRAPHSVTLTVAARKDMRFFIHSTGRDLKIGLRELQTNTRGE